MSKYIVCWIVDGVTRCGKPMTLEIAASWAKDMNKKYPNIYHFIKEAQ